MTSHLSAILNRLNEMIASDKEKEERNFKKDGEGEVVATVIYEKARENEEGEWLPEGFKIKYGKKDKEGSSFDSIDLVAIEIFELLY